MSFVVAVAEVLASAATDVAGIGSTVDAANAAAAAQTTGILAAAQDEVSEAIAALFSSRGHQYQALAAQAAAFHDHFVQALNASGGAYGSAEAANAAPLQDLLNVINAPVQTLTGRALIGEGANGAPGTGRNGASGRWLIGDGGAGGNASLLVGEGGTNGSDGSRAQTASQVVPTNGNAATPATASSVSAAAVTSSADASSSAAPSPVKTIPVGKWPGSLAVSPDGHYVYVANDGAGTVSVIDTSTGAVVGKPIPVGITPTVIVVSPDGSHVYVDGNPINGPFDTVDVVAINTATHAVSAPIPTSDVAVGASMAITPDGSRLYVADSIPATGDAGHVVVIDTATNSVVGEPIPIYDPGGIVVTPDGKSVYVTSGPGVFIPGTVEAINTATNTVTATFATPPSSSGLGLIASPDGKSVYITAGFGTSGATVSVIDTATNTIGNPTSLPGALDVTDSALSPDGHYLYLTDDAQLNNSNYSTLVSVYDTRTHTVSASIPMGSLSATAGGIAVSPNGQYVYVAGDQGGGTGTSTVTVVNTGSGTVSDQIPVGVSPTDIAISPNGMVYVTNTDSNTVSVIAPNTIGYGTRSGTDPGSYLQNALFGMLDLADGFAKTVVGFDPGIASYGLTLYDGYDFSTHFDGFVNGNWADAGHIALETPAIEFDVAGDILAFSPNLALKALGGVFSSIGGGFGALDHLL